MDSAFTSEIVLAGTRVWRGMDFTEEQNPTMLHIVSGCQGHRIVKNYFCSLQESYSILQYKNHKRFHKYCNSIITKAGYEYTVLRWHNTSSIEIYRQPLRNKPRTYCQAFPPPLLQLKDKMQHALFLSAPSHLKIPIKFHLRHTASAVTVSI